MGDGENMISNKYWMSPASLAVTLLTLIASCMVRANPEIVIGSTVAIAEVSILEEIHQSAAGVNLQDVISDASEWSGFKSERLPLATKNSVRLHRPMYTLERDITDQHGQIIYPKGYTFNPMSYITLPSKVIVVGDDASFGDWLAAHAGSFDMVLTAGGDPLKLGKTYDRTVFILEPKMRERLGVRVVPSIVSQKGDALQIKEMVLEAGSAKPVSRQASQRARDAS